MATSAICIVKTMRLQKPSPKDLATACGLDPFSSAAPATTTTAMAANTKASGKQRSAQAVKRRLRRLEEQEGGRRGRRKCVMSMAWGSPCCLQAPPSLIRRSDERRYLTLGGRIPSVLEQNAMPDGLERHQGFTRCLGRTPYFLRNSRRNTCRNAALSKASLPPLRMTMRWLLRSSNIEPSTPRKASFR